MRNKGCALVSGVEVEYEKQGTSPCFRG